MIKKILNQTNTLTTGFFVASTTALSSVFAGNVFAETIAEGSDCADLGATSGNPVQAGVNCTGGDQDITFFGNDGLFQTAVNVLLFLVGAVSVIMLIVGGIRYVVSAGDQNAVTGAKNTIMYAIIGLVVSFVAFAAVSFIVGSLTPSE